MPGLTLARETAAPRRHPEPGVEPDAAREGPGRYPRVLHVDTGFTEARHRRTPAWADTLDYGATPGVPWAWRRVERAGGLDWTLAFQARRRARHFDVVLAGSERVGIPLALLRPPVPVVTLTYHVASPRKRRLLRTLGAVRQWSRIGYLTGADRDVLIDYYGCPPEQLFRYIAAPLDQVEASPSPRTGPVLSTGVSKRDYGTLVEAARQLPDCRFEIYATSRYPDVYRGSVGGGGLPPQVQFRAPLPQAEMLTHHRVARFVVVPLEDTTQFSAGLTAALEAHAAGRAVVATATAGMQEYVEDGVTGLLVPPGDASALRDAVARLWRHPEQAAALGAEGRRRVARDYDPSDAERRLRTVLQAVHAERSSGPAS